MAKVRIDQLLVTLGLAPTRERAQALVMAGLVYVEDTRIEKAGHSVADDAEVDVRGGDHPYVSRGGVKLAGALDAFHVDPKDRDCLDLGASTGGFTDCLLQRGAKKVIAVDVGYGQLAHKLRIDPRVVVMERTNARTLTVDQIGGEVDLTVVDASFIGLALLLDSMAACTKKGGELVALVKPQFEVGREEATKSRGVIRDDSLRKEAISRVREEMTSRELEVLGESDCVIPGPKGNREAFLYAKKL